MNRETRWLYYHVIIILLCTVRFMIRHSSRLLWKALRYYKNNQNNKLINVRKFSRRQFSPWKSLLDDTCQPTLIIILTIIIVIIIIRLPRSNGIFTILGYYIIIIGWAISCRRSLLHLSRYRTISRIRVIINILIAAIYNIRDSENFI